MEKILNFEELLISLVKKNEVLYNKGKTGYKNCEVKSRIWRDIADKLGTDDETCIKRWRGLRDRFVREYRKQSTPSGSERGEHVTWELYDQLQFLKDHLLPKRNPKTIVIDTTEDVTESYACNLNETSYTSLASPSTPFESFMFVNEIPSEPQQHFTITDAPKPKKKKTEEGTKHLGKMLQQAMGTFKRVCESESNSNSNPVRTFMLAMSGKLEKLPLSLQNNAILQIAEYVIKLENFHNGISNEIPKLK